MRPRKGSSTRPRVSSVSGTISTTTSAPGSRSGQVVVRVDSVSGGTGDPDAPRPRSPRAAARGLRRWRRTRRPGRSCRPARAACHEPRCPASCARTKPGTPAATRASASSRARRSRRRGCRGRCRARLRRGRTAATCSTPAVMRLHDAQRAHPRDHRAVDVGEPVRRHVERHLVEPTGGVSASRGPRPRSAARPEATEEVGVEGQPDQRIGHADNPTAAVFTWMSHDVDVGEAPPPTFVTGTTTAGGEEWRSTSGSGRRPADGPGHVPTQETAAGTRWWRARRSRSAGSSSPRSRSSSQCTAGSTMRGRRLPLSTRSA